MKNFIVAFAVLASFNLSAQPANDDCAAATSLGTLPAPGACGTGIKNGTVVTVTGTNVNATSGNPYYPGCNTSNPVNDVWYTFVAPTNGYGATIHIAGGTLATPTVGLYTGTNCDSLSEISCAVGSANTVTLADSGDIIPGQTYYIQVSGNNATASGTFNLSVNAFQNCSDCLNSATLTATPPPVNGTYQPGQTVSFCFHIDQWTQTQNNWLHGVQMSFGPGWNLASLTTSAPPPYVATAAYYGHTPATCGYWAYYPAGETSLATGTAWPAGFYFNGTYSTNVITGLPDGCTSATDGNPGNNFGDGISNIGLVINPPSNEWDFCWTITVEAGCHPGVSLSVQVTTSGDGESGDWSSPGCANDPVTNFTAITSCCPPNMSSTPTCLGASGGTATATPIGSAGPYTYTWSAGGQTDSSETGLPSGNYTVTVVDANHCSASASTAVAVNSPPTPVASNTGPYCVGSTVQLAATGGVSYSWSGPNAFTSTSQAPAVPNLSAATAGVYTVTATDANGCTASSSTTVSISNGLSPVAANTGPYCIGSTIQLGVTGGTTYAWSGPNSFTGTGQAPSITGATIAMAGTYTVTATDPDGCSGTGTTTVVVYPAPTVTATNTGPYCVASTIQLNATGGTTYLWSGPNAYSNNTQNPTIINATTGMSGTYTVIVTDANGCTASASTPVVVSNSLMPVATNTGPYCAGSTVQLNVAGGTIFSWSGPNGFSSAAQAPAITGSTTAMAGTYDVTATDAGGCSGTGSTNVVVNPLPAPVASNTGPYCAGATIQLGALGGLTYAWSGPLAFAAAAQTPSIANSTVSMSGAYNVTATDANGCTAIASTNVVVNALPVANAGNGVVITCADPQPTLNAPAIPAGDTYIWNGPGLVSGGNTDTPAVNAAGTYTLTVTDVNNCSAVANVVVTSTITPPDVNPVTGGNLTCINTSVALIASSSVSGATFAWSNNVSTANNPVTVPNTYIVTVTDPSTGCTASASAVVGIDTTSPNVNAGPNETIGCVNGINLGGSSTTVNATYSWSGGNIAGGANTATPLVSTTGTYTLVVTDPANGCTASASTNVTSSNLPVIVGDVVENPCPNVSLGQINLQVAAGTPPYNYLWSNGATTQDIMALAGGTYNVTVTDLLSCSASGTYQVTDGSFIVQAEQNATINLGENVQLTGQVSGGSGLQTYYWTPDYNLSCVVCANPVATPYVNMVYVLQATDTNGCTGYDTITIHVIPLHTIYVPNAFSPNGDGNNDYFSVYGDLGLISFFEVKIFDRWGELVFESNKTDFAWDGTYKGIKEMPQVFVYVIKATFIDGYSPDPYKGSVTLVR